MQALVVHDDLIRGKALKAELQRSGFQTSLQASPDAADTWLKSHHVDLLLLRQVIVDRHTTGIALAAEYHWPDVATVLLSPYGRERLADLFEGLPSLAAALEEDADVYTLGAVCRAVITQKKTRPAMILRSPPAAMPLTALPAGSVPVIFGSHRQTRVLQTADYNAG
ncbi:MAG: hypothetical protein AAGF74_05040 [Pseudomonadota bacterium]